MEIKGLVVKVGSTEQVNDKFAKREIIIDVSDNPSYPSPVKFEAIQDKTSLLDGIKAGNSVDVSFNMNGREWVDKTGKTVYFVTLAIWRITASGTNNTPVMQPADVSSDDESDLPF